MQWFWKETAFYISLALSGECGGTSNMRNIREESQGFCDLLDLVKMVPEFFIDMFDYVDVDEGNEEIEMLVA